MALQSGYNAAEAAIARASLDVKAPQQNINDTTESELSSERVEPVTGKWELWAWYGYAFGNNSAGTLSYAPLIFQSVLASAGYNAVDRSLPCGDATSACVVKFGVANMNIATVVLVCNGIVFAVQGAILLLFGSMGDYGWMKRYILIACTLVCWGSQFGFLAIKDATQVQAAIVVYILSSLSYNLCVAFWYPSLPQLAANTPQAIETKRSYEAGEVSKEEYDITKMLQRNRLSNMAWVALSVGYTITLLVALGASYGLGANDSDSANLRAAVIIVGIATGVWILSGIPWFFFEKTRTVPLPKGENYLTVGLKTYWQAFRHAKRLSQTWLYLAGYFLLSDGYATTNQIETIVQNSIVVYSTTTSTGLYIVQGVSNGLGIFVFWGLQTKFKAHTKKVLIANCCFILLISTWGCIGIGTEKFGLHKTWEVWAYSVVTCAFASPIYAFAATMLSDLCPKGREVTFFSIYALVGKSTAWIGPIISGVIIDRTGNTYMGFPFALGMSVVGFALICCVDVEKGKAQCEAWEKSDPTLKRADDEARN